MNYYYICHNLISFPKALSLKRIFKDFELEISDFVDQFPEFKANYNASIQSMSGGERRLV